MKLVYSLIGVMFWGTVVASVIGYFASRMVEQQFQTVLVALEDVLR